MTILQFEMNGLKSTHMPHYIHSRAGGKANVLLGNHNHVYGFVDASASDIYMTSLSAYVSGPTLQHRRHLRVQVDLRISNIESCIKTKKRRVILVVVILYNQFTISNNNSTIILVHNWEASEIVLCILTTILVHPNAKELLNLIDMNAPI